MPGELLRGDPDVSDDSPNETLNLSDVQNDAINKIINAPPIAVGPVIEAAPQGGAPSSTGHPAHTADQFPVKNAQQFLTKFVLDSAGKEADDHVSRATDKTRVTEYLNLFGLDFADENGNPYPYCAAGLGFAACIGYCNMAPTESVWRSAYRRLSKSCSSFEGKLLSSSSVLFEYGQRRESEGPVD